MLSSSMPVPTRARHLEHVQVGQLCRACRSSGSSSRAPARARCRSSPRPRRSACCRNRFMSNGCLTIVTSLEFVRVDAVLRQRGEQLGLVAAAPDADLLALHLRDRVDPVVLPRELGHARCARRPARSRRCCRPSRAWRSRFGSQSRPNCAWPPSDDLLGRDVRAADLELHVEPGLLVVALLDAPRSSRRTAPASPT